MLFLELSGKEIKNLIRGAGLNIDDVADKAGISRATVSRFLNEHRSMRIDNLVKLKKAFCELRNKEEDTE